MPQDTPQPHHQPQSTAPTSPNIPTFRTNIPKPSFNKLIPVVIILAVLALAGLGTSIFFGIQNSSQSSEISDLKTQLSHQNPVVIVDDEEISEAPNPSEQPTDQPSVVTKADILAEVPSNLGLTSKKCLNCEYDTSYAISTGTTDFFSIRVEPNSTTASLNFSWEDIQKYYNISPEGKTGYENISNLQFSSPITDVFIAGFGQAVGDETALFLLSDGTVEYIPLYTAVKNNDFRSYGKLPELQNIIKFYLVNSRRTGGIGGGMDTLAQRADGKFYELYTLLESTGNYDDSRWRQ